MNSDARKIIVFTNPKAGRGLGAQLVAELSEYLTDASLEVLLTAEIDALRELADTHREEVRAVVTAGGDGTAETAVNATVRPDRAPIPIAVLPLGTENLLAKYLGISANPQQVCDVVLRGRERVLDAGRAGDKLFLLMLSCGFDADVVRRLHEDRQGNISHLAYAMPMIDAIRNYDYPNLQVTMEREDAAETIDCHWAFCFNAPSYAAGLRIVPQADPSDGQLDVATFGGGSFWHGLWQFSAVVLGQHQQLPDFRQERCRRLTISSEVPEVPYQLDGDPGDCLPVEVELLPQHWSVLAPVGDA